MNTHFTRLISIHILQGDSYLTFDNGISDALLEKIDMVMTFESLDIFRARMDQFYFLKERLPNDS